MLQRIYGTAWYDRAELDAYLTQLEEALKRDHRKLGADLDLYSVEEDAGARSHLLASQGRDRARLDRRVHPRRACANAAISRS